LWIILEDGWKNLLSEKINKLVARLPRLVKKLIK